MQRANADAFEGSGNHTDRSSADLLVSCLEGDRPLANEAALLVHELVAPFALVAIRPPLHRTLPAIHEIGNELRGMRIVYTAAMADDILVALVSYVDAHAFLENAIEKIGGNKCTGALSLPFSSVDDIGRQFDLVKYCLFDCDAGEIRDAQDAALAYLVSEISSTLDTSSLLHPALAKLARYDETNQSNLLNTLKVYLEHDRNAQRCANVLYLHRNSLQYRVRRIQEIAGIDLDDPSERAYLRLSLLLS